MLKFCIYLSLISLLLIISNHYFLDDNSLYFFSDNHSHHCFILYLDKYNITHKDLSIIEDYGVDILNIYPRNKLKIQTESIMEQLYVFNYYNALYLEKKYISILKKYSLHDDIDHINIFGINIDKIVVFSNFDNIYNLINKYPKITYED